MPPIRVLLAIPTYRRPASLQRLLKAVNRLALPPEARLSVTVFDNDASPRTEAAVTTIAAVSRFPITYRAVAKRGLAQVRNAALESAIEGGFDYLGFIDDDEAPSPRWLCAHLSALAETDAAGSMGPVRAVPHKRPPRWLCQGGFLNDDETDDLTMVGEGATSNTVFSMDPVRRHGLRFETAFDRTGGEDTVFFDRYLWTGARLVFAADASVFEWVPAHRLRLGWYWRRWRRTGQTNAWLRLVRHRQISRLRCGASGLCRFAIGTTIWLLALPLALVGHPAHWARGARIAARGVGYIDTALGYMTPEYGHPDR